MPNSEKGKSQTKTKIKKSRKNGHENAHANVSIANQDGNTALMQAAENGHKDRYS